jgi:hypothetical protein
LCLQNDTGTPEFSDPPTSLNCFVPQGGDFQ